MLSQKNKKNLNGLLLAVFFVASFSFLVLSVPDVFAQTDANSQAALQSNAGGEDNENFVVRAFKWILLALLNFLTGLVQVGASMFAWATRPEYISGPTGLLNLTSVYALWKFIRDFFNLFFIFLLLFSAFATIFQIEKFSIKKNFLKIVFAAVVINFSFPLVRMVIDLGNVPMYFFAQGLVNASGAGNALHSIPMSFFESSGMSSLLTNPGSSASFMSLISAIVFTFIFMITLFSLSFLFILRLLKLVILLIFSPIGLAASIIPGLGGLGRDYWQKHLLPTVFFGPAAMLMVVIALRFSQEIQSSQFVTGLSATAPAATAASQASIIQQSVFFIPVILMWMAMHMGNKFGVEGANAVISKADKVAAWGKKQALRPVGATWRGTKAVGRGAASPLTTRFKGLKSGLKDRFDDAKYGGKYWKDRGEAAEAKARGFASGGLEGRRKEIDKLRDKQAREQEKKWKDEGKTPSDILKELNDKNNYEKDGTPKAAALAAANFLANEKEAIKTSEDLTKILEIAGATNKKDLYEKALNSSTDDALNMSPDQLNKIREAMKITEGFKSPERPSGMSDVDYAKIVRDAENEFQEKFIDKIKTKFKKEGKTKVLIDYEIAENKRKGLAIPHREVYAKYMDKMKAKEVAQMKDMVDDSGKLDARFAEYLDRKKKSGEWSIKDLQDAYAELNSKQKKAWKAEGLEPRPTP